MELFESGPVYLYRFPVSGRYGIPALSTYARQMTGGNDTAWVVFITANRKSLKAICVRPDCVLLFERRLNRGKYPQLLTAVENGEATTVSRSQLQALFDCTSKAALESGRQPRRLVV